MRRIKSLYIYIKEKFQFNVQNNCVAEFNRKCIILSQEINFTRKLHGTGNIFLRQLNKILMKTIKLKKLLIPSTLMVYLTLVAVNFCYYCLLSNLERTK